MLSPCIRQVTHALLTRPPLSCESLGFISAPFDLHVLSTPPAFILSQDQTLMLYSSISCDFYQIIWRCARTGGRWICKNLRRCKLNEIDRRSMNCGCITKYGVNRLSVLPEYLALLFFGSEFSRIPLFSNFLWNSSMVSSKLSFSLPFDFPMLRIACATHCKNLILEFSGLHYCLFVKVHTRLTLVLLVAVLSGNSDRIS